MRFESSPIEAGSAVILEIPRRQRYFICLDNCSPSRNSVLSTSIWCRYKLCHRPSWSTAIFLKSKNQLLSNWRYRSFTLNIVSRPSVLGWFLTGDISISCLYSSTRQAR
ncbi:Os01g0799050 [Oryza sativa Japonica Group]|uniref:Os01g0799050 protein n=1 Tax=Oryza sativa subsp. japonica TaxID=39947 RepID=A0A0P0V9A4_ORYSJ|nr:hypothetical protein EE612_006287 [Oryza sativa]BAS74781.1 Os01g0799050 [Oryza sativa Japonica Group]